MTCRACGASALLPYTQFPDLPLANALAPTAEAARTAPRYPLAVALCWSCGLSQLAEPPPPVPLFDAYVYRSGMAKGYKAHCQWLASQVTNVVVLADIAGNDGTLIREFERVHPGMIGINIDPARNFAEETLAHGIPTVCGYWPEAAAEVPIDQVDVFTATNVFGHVPDPRAFLQGFRQARRGATILLEVPYIKPLLDLVEFDTIYFEHQTYWGKAPLVELAVACGLRPVEIQETPIHGGSILVRLLVEDGPPAPEVLAQVADEQVQGLYDFRRYEGWWARVEQKLERLRPFRGAAFGASAKGNTLLNTLGFGTDQVAYIADDTPEKQGKFSPGTGIPIVPRSYLQGHPPDQLLLLAWNFGDEILQSLPWYTGRIWWP